MASTRLPLQVQNLNIHQTEMVQQKNDTRISKHLSTIQNNVDVAYFRNLLIQERTRILNLCEVWERVLVKITNIDNMDIVLGDIRTVVGQAHLVVDERFLQFEGLVNNCEFHTSEKTVTCQDLQGFWDMINFQVEDICKKFEDLEVRKKNQWKGATAENSLKPKKKVVSKNIKKHQAVNPAAQARKEEARKRLASAKAALKKERRLSITFDAGFFQVDSPVRASVKQPRTPQDKDPKPPVTPTSANFMHGRFIQQAMGVDFPSSKKSLVFQFPDSESDDFLVGPLRPSGSTTDKNINN